MAKRTQEQFAEELSKINSSIMVLGQYTGVDYRIKVKCLKCGNEWEPFASNLLAGRGCRYCANRKTTKQFIDEMNMINPNITVLGDYIKSNTPIPVMCDTCGNKWAPTPNSLLQGEGCPKCGKRSMADKQRKTDAQFKKEAEEANPLISVLGTYNRSNH